MEDQVKLYNIMVNSDFMSNMIDFIIKECRSMKPVEGTNLSLRKEEFVRGALLSNPCNLKGLKPNYELYSHLIPIVLSDNPYTIEVIEQPLNKREQGLKDAFEEHFMSTAGIYIKDVNPAKLAKTNPPT